MPFAQLIESNSVNSNRYQMIHGHPGPVAALQDDDPHPVLGWVDDDRTTTSTSALMDDALFDFDHLFVTNSQSNTGNQNSRPEAWAKNVAGVGGFNHYDNADPSDDCWCGTGSTGPAQDGRVGVSFAAYYDNIRTTSSSRRGSRTSDRAPWSEEPVRLASSP